MKPRWAAFTAVVFLAIPGCEEGPSKPPVFKDIRPVPRSFAQEIIARRKIDGLSIRVYNTATVESPGRAVSEMKSVTSKTRLDVPAFLIRHPAKGYLLFDTGLHPDVETEPEKKLGRVAYFFVPFKMGPGQNILSQLKADRIPVEKLKWVVLSHLHVDHAGMPEAFPGAEVIIDRREWDGTVENKGSWTRAYDFDVAAWKDHPNLRLVDLSSAAPYGSFDRAEDLFGDGTVYLVDLAGHTPGNLGLWVNLDSGPVLLTGDASWILDNHQNLALPLKGHIADIKEYWRRLFMIKSLQEAVPQLVVFPGHDLAPLRLQPRPDVTLAPYPR